MRNWWLVFRARNKDKERNRRIMVSEVGRLSLRYASRHKIHVDVDRLVRTHEFVRKDDAWDTGASGVAFSVPNHLGL